MNLRNSEPASMHGIPPTSEVPPAEPPPSIEEVAPPIEVPFGGIENIPQELMPPAEQAADEIDHAGLEESLPGEDQERAPGAGGPVPRSSDG